MNLKDLTADKAVLADLKNYFDSHLNELALDSVFNKKDTSGMADAKAVIEKVFQQLDIDYSPKVEPKNQNNAR